MCDRCCLWRSRYRRVDDEDMHPGSWGGAPGSGDPWAPPQGPSAPMYPGYASAPPLAQAPAPAPSPYMRPHEPVGYGQQPYVYAPLSVPPQPLPSPAWPPAAHAPAWHPHQHSMGTPPPAAAKRGYPYPGNSYPAGWPDHAGPAAPPMGPAYAHAEKRRKTQPVVSASDPDIVDFRALIEGKLQAVVERCAAEGVVEMQPELHSFTLSRLRTEFQGEQWEERPCVGCRLRSEPKHIVRTAWSVPV